MNPEKEDGLAVCGVRADHSWHRSEAMMRAVGGKGKKGSRYLFRDWIEGLEMGIPGRGRMKRW